VRGGGSSGGGGLVVAALGGGDAPVFREGGDCGGCRASLLGAVWGGEEVVPAFYRRRRSVPEQKISPTTLA
jgi:hypothetical protein